MNQMTKTQAESDVPMLKVTGLSHRVALAHDTLTILEGVNLEILRGESVAIVGRSGSGKTALLGLLAGLDTPSEGSILLDGAVISELDEDERARRGWARLRRAPEAVGVAVRRDGDRPAALRHRVARAPALRPAVQPALARAGDGRA